MTAEACVRCKADSRIIEPQEVVAEVRGERLCHYHMLLALKETVPNGCGQGCGQDSDSKTSDAQHS